jgi:peptidoglycan DL-endopeptidase LytE
VENEEQIQLAQYKSAPVPRSSPASSVTAVSGSKAPAATQLRTHTVKDGESLGVIARRYGVSVTDIKRWNGLRSDMIRVGQKLKIGGSPTAGAGSTVDGARGTTPGITVAG